MWNLLLNEDERMIADSVRAFLARELPIARLRPKAAPIDAARVRDEMADLGWLAVGLPEEAGGSGLGLVEEMLIQRECGRYMVSPSFLASVLAAQTATAAGDTALALSFASGATTASMAILQQTTADSRACYALDWTDGELLLAWDETGMGLFEASAFTAVTADESLDDSVTLHVGKLAFGKPMLWVAAEEAPLSRRAEVLAAAHLVGLAEHACELAVEYAKMRHQFGKPIGSFQAVKHRCADMGVRWRLAWHQTCLAALKVQASASDAKLQAASAKLVAANAAHENGRAAIQVHGAIGFQSECDVHWFMKRAHIFDQLGGSIAVQSRRIIAEPCPL